MKPSNIKVIRDLKKNHKQNKTTKQKKIIIYLIEKSFMI